MSATFDIRPFTADDLEPLVTAMRETLELPGIDGDAIARDFLLAPGFAKEHLLIGDTDGTLAGFVLAPRNDALGPQQGGWLAAFGVRTPFRRQGIAKALIGGAVDGMRLDGVKRLDVADVPVRYLLPGVDPVSFPVAHRWLTRGLGFAVRDEVASMGLDFSSATLPDGLHRDIRPFRPGEFPLLKAFLNAEFDVGWWGYFERSILARLSGDPTPSDTFGAFDGNVPIGCVHYRANRFGPLAVGAKARGKGLGGRLTRSALAAIRGHGYANAYFMVAEPDVQPFYERIGFTVLRRFTRVTRNL